MGFNQHETHLTVNEIMTQLKISKTTVYDLVKRRGFPKPLRIGGSSRWIEEEVSAYLEEQKAKRDLPQQPTRRGRPRKLAS